MAGCTLRARTLTKPSDECRQRIGGAGSSHLCSPFPDRSPGCRASPEYRIESRDTFHLIRVSGGEIQCDHRPHGVPHDHGWPIEQVRNALTKNLQAGSAMQCGTVRMTREVGYQDLETRGQGSGLPVPGLGPKSDAMN